WLISRWKQDDKEVVCNKNLFISGAATAGKTAFLKALVDCPYLSVGVGSNRSKLFQFGRYKSSNDFFIIEKFKHEYHVQTLKSFLKGRHMIINVPHSSVTKTKKTPVIIISNAPWDRSKCKKRGSSDEIILSLE
ncbi:unnamed protein product, partial [Phaeothamnion confervicola]